MIIKVLKYFYIKNTTRGERVSWEKKKIKRKEVFSALGECVLKSDCGRLSTLSLLFLHWYLLLD